MNPWTFYMDSCFNWSSGFDLTILISHTNRHYLRPNSHTVPTFGLELASRASKKYVIYSIMFVVLFPATVYTFIPF